MTAFDHRAIIELSTLKLQTRENVRSDFERRGEGRGRPGEEEGAIGGEDKGDVEDGEDLDPRAIVEPVYGKRKR